MGLGPGPWSNQSERRTVIDKRDALASRPEGVVRQYSTIAPRAQHEAGVGPDRMPWVDLCAGTWECAKPIAALGKVIVAMAVVD